MMVFRKTRNTKLKIQMSQIQNAGRRNLWGYSFGTFEFLSLWICPSTSLRMVSLSILSLPKYLY